MGRAAITSLNLWGSMKQPSQAIKEPPATDLPATNFPKIGLHSLADLQASLEALTGLHAAWPREVREHVIRAKDRARWAARNTKASEEKRRLKAEMVQWMLVWLDDPAMFQGWARLRLAAMDCQGTGRNIS